MGTQVHATCCSLGMPLFPDSQHGGTPLHFACMSGHALVCKMLLLRGASVNIRQRKVRDLACIALHCIAERLNAPPCVNRCCTLLLRFDQSCSLARIRSTAQLRYTWASTGTGWSQVACSSRQGPT